MPRFANIYRAMRRAAVLPLAVSLIAANCGLAAENPPDSQATMLAAADTPLIKKTGKSKPSPAEIKPVASKAPATSKQEEPLPTQTRTSSSKKAWIYGGLGVAAAAAIVAVAVGGGGGGGGSDAPATTPPDNNGGTGTNNDNSPTCDDLNKVNKNPRPPVSNNPDNTPVCADLSGQWSGTEDLIGDNGLSITATIAQDGDKLQITTSSNKYGKVFIGTVDANCNINAYDQTTGEEWSTRYGPVTTSRIALYDDISIECDGHSTSDSLILSR